FWCFFFSSRRRHTRLQGDWSSDVCSSDLSWAICLRACLFWLSQWFASLASSFSGQSLRIGDPWRSPRGPARASVVTNANAAELKIGRASCRERVEQTGGAGYSTNKSEECR